MRFSSFFFSFLDYVEIVLKPRVGAWGGRFNQSADFQEDRERLAELLEALYRELACAPGRGG